MAFLFTTFRFSGRGNTVFNPEHFIAEEKEHLDETASFTCKKFMKEMAKLGLKSSIGRIEYNFKVHRYGRVINDVTSLHADD